MYLSPAAQHAPRMFQRFTDLMRFSHSVIPRRRESCASRTVNDHIDISRMDESSQNLSFSNGCLRPEAVADQSPKRNSLSEYLHRRVARSGVALCWREFCEIARATPGRGGACGRSPAVERPRPSVAAASLRYQVFDWATLDRATRPCHPPLPPADVTTVSVGMRPWAKRLRPRRRTTVRSTMANRRDVQPSPAERDCCECTRRSTKPSWHC